MKLLIPSFLSLVLIVSVAAINIRKAPRESVTPECCESGWKANVHIEGMPADRNQYMLPEKMFIQKGYAEVKQDFSDHYRFWTNIELSIPCTRSINTDNVKLEWYSKSNMSINAGESDMGASLFGDRDTATVNCITYYRPPYTVFRFGKKKLTDVPELVSDPSAWSKYALEISGKTLKFYKNGVLKKQLKDNQALGMLRKIIIHFKGSGKVDWVKLYEKDKLVFNEEFNITGKSSVKWAR